MSEIDFKNMPGASASNEVTAITSSKLPKGLGVLLSRKPKYVSHMIRLEKDEFQLVIKDSKGNLTSQRAAAAQTAASFKLEPTEEPATAVEDIVADSVDVVAASVEHHAVCLKQPIAAPQVPAVLAAEPVVAMEVPVTPAVVLAVAATVPVLGGEERDDTSKSSCRQLLSLFCAPMHMLCNAVLLLVEQTTGTKVSKAAGASSRPSCSPLLQCMLWNAVLLWVERAATGKDTKAGAASSKPSRSPQLQRMLWGAALSWVESAATAKVTKSSGDSSQPSSRPILLPMLGNAVLSCVQKAAYAKVIGSAKRNCSPLLRLLCNAVLLLQDHQASGFMLQALGLSNSRPRSSGFRLHASGSWIQASRTPGHRLLDSRTLSHRLEAKRFWNSSLLGLASSSCRTQPRPDMDRLDS
eukprot:gene29090-32303_t